MLINIGCEPEKDSDIRWTGDDPASIGGSMFSDIGNGSSRLSPLVLTKE